jgi:Reverse transcriptase (RNA-dependent DNA polymerase)
MLKLHNTTIDSNTPVLLLLKKDIYGLVQDARQWWKKFKDVMAGCNYYPSKLDPCLFIKQDEKVEPLYFVLIYVDDGGIIGTPDSIREVNSALAKSFKVKTMGELENFVSVKSLTQLIRMVSGYIDQNLSKRLTSIQSLEIQQESSRHLQLQRQLSSVLKKAICWSHLRNKRLSEWELGFYFIW